ncbi:conserved hypothetical protein [Gammaproteobacteria bacterium]
MKPLFYVLTTIIVASGQLAYGQEPRDNSGRPCFDVNVQIDRNNKTNVKQDCGYNDSRTMQAGQNNNASTTQRGAVNTNEVKQYEFNAVRRPSR